MNKHLQKRSGLLSRFLYFFADTSDTDSTKSKIIDLKGFAIGNGLTDPSVQFASYPTMAYNSGTAPRVVTDKVYKKMMAAVPHCHEKIAECNAKSRSPNVLDRFLFDGEACIQALVYCQMHLMLPVQKAGVNVYNLNEKCPPGLELCYNFTKQSDFLNSVDVQHELGVFDQIDWESCNKMVSLGMTGDYLLDWSYVLPEMLENGIQGLLYAGDQDFICNWIGNKNWVLQMDWAGADKFRASPDVDVFFERLAPDDTKYSKESAGLLRKYDTLSFFQVYGAGHMVPMDQPRRGYFMMEAFLNGRLNYPHEQSSKEF